MAVPDAASGPSRRWSRWRYRARVLLHEPTMIIGAILTLLLLYLVIAPLVSVISDSVRVQFPDEIKTGLPAGDFTSYYFWRVMRSSVSSSLFWEPFQHTVVVSVGVTLFAVIVGGSMAWLVTRTDVAGRKWLSAGVVA